MEFRSGRLSFTADVQGIRHQHEVALVPVLPGERLLLQIVTAGSDARFSAQASAGTLTATGPNVWTWQAPREKGLYPLRLTRLDTQEQMQLQVFVQVPFATLRKGRLNGYRIGKYPKPRLGEPGDTAPKGFIEVTPDNENTAVSPHFVLKQFVSKQTSGYPRYVLIEPRLLTKLEVLLQEVNERGITAHTFHVMSGYRTPFYNAAINNVAYSRHVWGSAADIFVDANPQDGEMDDLNRDGRTDRADASWLYRLTADFHQRHPQLELEGGVGEYDRNAAHGPFVHVDVRGKAARWGHKPTAD